MIHCIGYKKYSTDCQDKAYTVKKVIVSDQAYCPVHWVEMTTERLSHFLTTYNLYPIQMVCIYLTYNSPKYKPPNLKVPQIFKISDFELVLMCDVPSTYPHSQMSFVQCVPAPSMIQGFFCFYYRLYVSQQHVLNESQSCEKAVLSISTTSWHILERRKWMSKQNQTAAPKISSVIKSSPLSESV